MRLAIAQCKRNDGDKLMALDWEAVGRLVRRRTIEEVAAHFAALAAKSDDASADGSGQHHELDDHHGSRDRQLEESGSRNRRFEERCSGARDE